MNGDSGCDHPGPQGAEAVCEHVLSNRERRLDCYRWFLGRGMESELLCEDCTAQRRLDRAVVTKRICQECLDSFLKDAANLKGVRGSPGIRENLIPIRDAPVVLPSADYSILDLDPIAGSPYRWLGLDARGRVVSIDTQSSAIRTVAQIAPIPEPGHEPWDGHKLFHRIHASVDGEHVAMVNDYGQRGLVAEVAWSKVTMELNGGIYDPETVPFSFRFASYQGQSIVVHRTDWNRLDVSDPSTGLLLTDRGPTSYQQGENRPVHYLDYFHGRLHLSPNGKKLLDDGWLWHPMGIPAVWSLERWLGGNVWESEDGPSRVELCCRTYCWDDGMCWLDNGRVAIGGLGDHINEMVPGARVFDVSEEGVCREIGAFPGPAGSFYSDGSHLFSCDDSGLSIWDVEEGVRVGRLAAFKPQRMHPASNEFIEIRPDCLLVWKSDAL